MEQNLIFFDIDGTIIDEHNHIPESAIASIRAARANGNICIINTGRPFSHIENSVKDIGFDGYICSCGQHIIIDSQDLLYKTVSADVCKEVIKLVDECSLDALYESEKGYSHQLNHYAPSGIKQNESRFLERGYPAMEDYRKENYTFDKLCVFISPDSNPAKFFAYVSDFFTCIDRGNNMFELVIKCCSKETGVHQVIDHLNLPLNNCYAIGDSTNDIPMLRIVPHSIAMGNAPEIVQSMCEYVTDGLSEDGVANALKHYEII